MKNTSHFFLEKNGDRSKDYPRNNCAQFVCHMSDGVSAIRNLCVKLVQLHFIDFNFLHSDREHFLEKHEHFSII